MFSKYINFNSFPILFHQVLFYIFFHLAETILAHCREKKSWFKIKEITVFPERNCRTDKEFRLIWNSLKPDPRVYLAFLLLLYSTSIQLTGGSENPSLLVLFFFSSLCVGPLLRGIGLHVEPAVGGASATTGSKREMIGRRGNFIGWMVRSGSAWR